MSKLHQDTTGMGELDATRGGGKVPELQDEQDADGTSALHGPVDSNSPVGDPQRRQEALKSLAPGCGMGFFTLALAGLFTLVPPAFQHQLAADLDWALLPGHRLVGGLPREHGKTTLGTTALVVREACRCSAEADGFAGTLGAWCEARDAREMARMVAEAKLSVAELNAHLDGPGEVQVEDGRRAAAPTIAAPTIVAPTIAAPTGVYSPKRHILIVGASKAEACQRLALIKDELENNEYIQTYFPSATQPLRNNRGHTVAYRQDEIVLACGMRIAAIGATGKVRGALFQGRRPDLILLDDPEDDRCANSQKLRDRMRAWCARALLPALDNMRGSMVWLGTLLHHDSVLARWIEEHRGSRQQAADSRQQEENACATCVEPGSMSGANSVEANKLASQPAGQFHAASCLDATDMPHSSLSAASCLPPASSDWRTIFLPAIDEDGAPLWPGKWPLALLHRRRDEIGDRAFAQEYLLRPVSAEAQRFRPHDFVTYDPQELQYKGGRHHIHGQELTVVIGVDPAIGGKEENDFFSAAVVGFTEERAESQGPRAKSLSYEVLGSSDPSPGPRPLAPGPIRNEAEDHSGQPQMRAYVLEVVRIKDRFARQVEILRELNRRWQPRVVGIESTAYQRVLSQASCDHGLPVKELEARGPKEYRIEALSATVAQHCWHLPVEAHWASTLRDEALGYPSARHDDQLDALARAQEVGLELLDNWRRRSERGAHRDGAWSVSGVKAG